jgi:NAD(P)-dependent dehydrogenase (short-subunit alcohol dehydrogenase family)
MPGWTTHQIPDQTGRIVVITGATSGLGRCCARTLAAHGAEVILAVRNITLGQAMAAEIANHHPNAKLAVIALDLASLASIADFAAHALELPRIDVLLNNAGLGLMPERQLTKDGFELQWGTNHLGHFALTARLIPALLRAPTPRVVTVASMAHRRGTILWDDPNQARHYSGRTAYNQSKLANLMFALELAARAREQGSKLSSIAAHPGLALTGFLTAAGLPGWMRHVGILASKILGQSAEAGSWPSLYAATMADVANGDYWGPDGFKEIRGLPARATVWPHARNRADWQRLWAITVAQTGIDVPPLV